MDVHFYTRIIAIILISICLIQPGQQIFLKSTLFAAIYKLYLRRGIPFREHSFLGNKPILKEYDFVIIGAGPGGSVVANRLSEIPQWKVLLLEAGVDETIYTDIPATVSYSYFSGYNWGYKAEKAEGGCLAAEDQRCPWPRGKGMGGTSIINYMIYTRGNKKDYDRYAAAGNTGWSYKEVLPYFLRSENCSIEEYQNSTYHAKGGPLHISRVPHKTRLVDAFLEAGQELGYNIVDYNEPSIVGFSRIQATMRNGRRVSASKAFVKSVKHRSNLHVSIQSMVTKILIDPETKKAYGVEFVKNRKKRVVLARKEVILSAGALNSPQLLMLSGVGPKEHLRELDIPVIQDSKVGENLQEHYVNTGLAFLVNVTNVSLKEENLNLNVFLNWLNKGKGELTLPGGVEGIAYINTKHNYLNSDYPDLEFIFSAGSLASDGGETVSKSFGVSDCFYDELFGRIKYKDTWTIFPMILHPKTIGKIRLSSKNPWAPPKFYFNYFEDQRDLDVMVEGIKEVIKLSKTKAFQKLGTRLNPARLSRCSEHEYNSDQYWACFARYFTGTIHHQCGTCKMGPKTDPTAVVDPELRVYGIQNLRVVDASILPEVPAAHLYAPTLMVGEKGADMIKSAWLSPAEQEAAVQNSHFRC